MKHIDEVTTLIRALWNDSTHWYVAEHDDGTVEPKVSINVNDVFFWGCADSEDIEVEDLPLFCECTEACKAAGDPYNGSLLYAARKRGERPQGAFYTYIEQSAWPLFDACGPEREVDFGNPYKPGEYKPTVGTTGTIVRS
jgi:hypothetical protein